MDCLTLASSSEPLGFFSRLLDRADSCSISNFWALFTSSSFEALEIQAAFKDVISKANLQKRVHRWSDQFAGGKVVYSSSASSCISTGAHPLLSLLHWNNFSLLTKKTYKWGKCKGFKWKGWGEKGERLKGQLP